MFLSDFFFFCQSTATVLILRYCLMNTAVNAGFFLCTGSPKGKRCLTATGDPRASRVRLRLPYSIVQGKVIERRRLWNMFLNAAGSKRNMGRLRR
jgi:hypothetical protein